LYPGVCTNQLASTQQTSPVHSCHFIGSYSGVSIPCAPLLFEVALLELFSSEGSVLWTEFS